MRPCLKVGWERESKQFVRLALRLKIHGTLFTKVGFSLVVGIGKVMDWVSAVHCLGSHIVFRTCSLGYQHY